MPADILVFLGPSFPLEQARALCAAEFRPPAGCGDIYRACATDLPKAILLIDGVFEGKAAVFHKEILWALQAGVRVYGAASMGALRAAELDSFGMVGFGKIYAQYRDGHLERDDAVAVLHGPAELGYPLLTVALVDILASLEKAEGERIISTTTHKQLAALAGSLFYKDRTYERLLENAEGQFENVSALRSLRAWLQINAVSQKALDTIDALKYLAATDPTLRTVPEPSFRFSPTVMWYALKEEVDREIRANSPQVHAFGADLTRGSSHEARETEALAYVLARESSDRDGTANNAEALIAAAEHFRRMYGLIQPEDVEAWLQSSELTKEGYLEAILDECAVRAMKIKFRSQITEKVAAIAQRRRSLEGGRSETF